MKKRHGISLLLITAFAVFSVFSFQKSLTPYVSLAQARESGMNVQVKGILVDKQVQGLADNKGIAFRLRDAAGEEVQVLYPGTKPDNMEHAQEVVVIGRYAERCFQADKLLVKCPSKYERQGKGASS